MMELRVILLCVVCVLLGHCLQATVSQDCSTGGEDCDTTPLLHSNVTYREVSSLKGYNGMDVCLLVSGASSMSGKHLWLQKVVTLLEEQFNSLDIVSNQYCLVHFGSNRRSLTGHFLTANDNVFFPSNDFVLARRRLQKKGDVADGYEAVQFTLSHAPFRTDPRIGRALLLVTDMGRTALAASSHLNRDNVFSLLAGHETALNVVVDVSMRLPGRLPGKIVLGLHDTHTVSTLSENGASYEIMDSNVEVTSVQGNTVEDYVTLATASGGSSWPLSLLATSNLTVLKTFVRAFVTENDIQRTLSVSVCEECECVQVGVGGECARRDCVKATDQETCRCLANNAPTECLTPSPVTPEGGQSSVLNPQPTSIPRPLLVTGAVDQFPGGEVELSFNSTINRASYECVFLTNDTDTPQLLPCSSPYYLKSLPSGDHKMLVIGKRKDSIGTRIFAFTLTTPTLPHITPTAVDAGNGSLRVETQHYGFSLDVTLYCSLAGGPFYQCGVSEVLSAERLGTDQSVFVVVAIGNRGLLAAGSLLVQRPYTKPTGPIVVGIPTVDAPDPFGRIRIRYNTSRPDVRCLCRIVGLRLVDCSAMEYTSDPRVLGGGDHTLSITCMDEDGYADNKLIKFSLSLPPTPPPGPLSCDVHVRIQEHRLVADYTCDRRVMATCQVSSLQQESCNSPSGIYVANVSTLGGGPHVFILCVDDGFGKTLMKILPFTIGTAQRKCCPLPLTAQRKCCPLINSTLSLLNISQPHDTSLYLSVAPGNCSLSEGFSYSVAWGDGSIDSGTLVRLEPLHTSHRYQESGHGSEDSGSGYNVEVSYCNNPSIETNICCSSLVLPVEPH
ncbi:uncharacterized protein LOC135343401 isoform X3 [Halichondria panicea]|uniref:uncharacterized protein LOC135343401 isoform X3 n=1 Tax=Halichondria panicea TaxID=6063 RepID=UPI00312BC5A5